MNNYGWQRAVRDTKIIALIEAERERQKFFRRFGARKMWLHLRGQGHDVARCTVERFFGQQGWSAALRQRCYRRPAVGEADRPLDLVDRQVWASRPNQLWVADFT